MKNLGLILILFPGLLFAQTKKQYIGYISSKWETVNISMQIHIENDSIKGIYYYEAIGTDLAVKGNIHDNQIILEESNSAGKLTGIFNLSHYVSGDSMNGEWVRSKDNAIFKVHLERADWTDYKLVKNHTSHYVRSSGKKTKIINCDWLQMMGYPDTKVQYHFNTQSHNIEPLAPNAEEAIEYYYKPDEKGDSLFYMKEQSIDILMSNNYFISYRVSNSKLYGETINFKSISYYLYDLQHKKILKLNDILRTDTGSVKILQKWITQATKNKDELYSFEQFYLAKDGLYFFFARPHTDSYVVGEEDIRISYHEFIKIVDRNSVVYAWLKERENLLE